MYFKSSKLYIEGYLYCYDHLLATPLTLIRTGGGKNAFAPIIGSIALKPTKRETWLWSLNLSLSFTVALKKKLALYVPRFNSDGPPKSGASDFQIAKS